MVSKAFAPILCVVGARPNFMKMAPLMDALGQDPGSIPTRLVHTGQHYDAGMKDAFFRQLGIPEPDIDLEVGSGTHAWQTAEIMKRFEPVLDAEEPSAVLVVGDVNSTIACALVAVKKQVPVIHVEAGLRSRDRGMPEEINRVLTDQISDLLFTTERSARENLLQEGINDKSIHFVGNVMIDTLRRNLPKAVAVRSLIGDQADPDRYQQEGRGFAVLTLHRPSNVDDIQVFRTILESVRTISERLPVIFPVHPRTRERIDSLNLRDLLDTPEILLLEPQGYLEMLGLISAARLVMTDSGGLQEETTALGVPCITLRNSTERPVTVDEGTNTIVGQDPDRILAAVSEVLGSGGKQGRVPEFWDGQAAVRIKAVLNDWLQGHQNRLLSR